MLVRVKKELKIVIIYIFYLVVQDTTCIFKSFVGLIKVLSGANRDFVKVIDFEIRFTRMVFQ